MWAVPLARLAFISPAHHRAHHHTRDLWRYQYMLDYQYMLGSSKLTVGDMRLLHHPFFVALTHT